MTGLAPATPLLGADAGRRIVGLLADEGLVDRATSMARPRVRRLAFLVFLAFLAMGLHAGARGGFLAVPADVVPGRFEASMKEPAMSKQRFSRTVATAAALFVGATASGQEAVQWRVEDGGNGHWYQRVTAPAGSLHWRFEDAGVAALHRGASLACFETTLEGWTVYELLGIASLGARSAGWIGLFQDQSAPDFAEPAGGWRWVSGEPLTYSFWHVEEPDNRGCHVNGNIQDYGKWIGGQADGDVFARWSDEGDPSPSCNYGTTHAIVEWSADCNGDGIVDYGQILAGELDDLNSNGVPDCCDDATSCGCPSDIDDSGVVNSIDLAIILASWGTDGGKYPRADVDGSGNVDALDLASVLSDWGPCP